VPKENTGNMISSIKKYKSKVVVSIGKEKLELSSEVLSSFYLYQGKNLTTKEKKEIIAYNESISLLSYALSLRKKAIYSEYRFREKLYAKGGSKDSIDRVIKKLKDYDLINDKMFALDYLEYANSIGYGKNKIVNKLKEKGIFDKEIDKLSFPQRKEISKAKLLLPKMERKYSKYNNEQKRNHIIGALISQGYDRDVINFVINDIKPSSSKEENKKLDKDFEKMIIKYKSKYDDYELKERVINSLRNKGYKIKDIINKWSEKYD